MSKDVKQKRLPQHTFTLTQVNCVSSHTTGFMRYDGVDQLDRTGHLFKKLRFDLCEQQNRSGTLANIVLRTT
jgi:hypothetical protein